MSTTSDKREARPKTTARADQLRLLNLPQSVSVELGDDGLPVSVTVACPPAPLHLCTSATDEDQVEAMASDVAGNTTGAEVQTSSYRTAPGQRRRNSSGLKVEAVIEIWHIDDEWWREPLSRRYVEVILEGGKHVVLYEDLTGGGWYMQMP